MGTLEGLDELRLGAGRLVDAVGEYAIGELVRMIAAAGGINNTGNYLAYRAKALGVDLPALEAGIAARLGKTRAEIGNMFTGAAKALYSGDAKRLRAAVVPFEENRELQRIVQAQCRMTQGTFDNLTRTKGLIDPLGHELPLREYYTNTMDWVFNNVAAGVMSHDEAVRWATDKLAAKGLTAIGYQSGAVTRLDTAVRRCVLGGLGLMAQEVAQRDHDEMGADGWEISAHERSAPDHEPVQGRQYPDGEYHALNGGLARPIGTLNCGHYSYPVVMGINQPVYSPEQLAGMAARNAQGVTVDGKHYTGYGATQKMRRLETDIRRRKERFAAAKGSGVAEDIARCGARLNVARQKYAAFAGAAGLRQQAERTRTTGFGKTEASAAGAISRRINAAAKLQGVYTSQGTLVSGVSRHASERLAERAVTPKGIEKALTSPLKVDSVRVDKDGRRSVRYIGEAATVNINPDTGRISTVWPTGERVLRRIKEAKSNGDTME